MSSILDQVVHGVSVRMAVLFLLLGSGRTPAPTGGSVTGGSVTGGSASGDEGVRP